MVLVMKLVLRCSEEAVGTPRLASELLSFSPLVTVTASGLAELLCAADCRRSTPSALAADAAAAAAVRTSSPPAEEPVLRRLPLRCAGLAVASAPARRMEDAADASARALWLWCRLDERCLPLRRLVPVLPPGLLVAGGVGEGG